MRLGASACFRRYIAGGARPNVGATSKPTRNALHRDDPLVAFLGETIAVTDEIYQVRDFDVDDAILSVREDVASIRECDGHHEMSDSGADGERVHTIAESGAQVCPHQRLCDGDQS